jgi:hypothetical protein
MDVSQNGTSSNQPILENLQKKRVSRIRRYYLITSTVCRKTKGVRISESSAKKTTMVLVVLLTIMFAPFFIKGIQEDKSAINGEFIGKRQKAGSN